MSEERVLIIAIVTDLHDNSISYPSCSRCYSKLLVDPTSNRYHCLKCGTSLEERFIDWRYRLVTSVADSAVIGKVVVFGHTLDGLFGKTATDFKRSLDDLEKSGYPAKVMLSEALSRTFHGKYFYFGFKLTECLSSPSLADIVSTGMQHPCSQFDRSANFDNTHAVAYQMIAGSDGVYATVTDHMRLLVKQLKTGLRNTPCRTPTRPRFNLNSNNHSCLSTDRTTDSSYGCQTLSFNSRQESIKLSFEESLQEKSHCNETSVKPGSCCSMETTRNKSEKQHNYRLCEQSVCSDCNNPIEEYEAVSFDEDLCSHLGESFLGNFHHDTVKANNKNNFISPVKTVETLNRMQVTQKLDFSSDSDTDLSTTCRRIDRELRKREKIKLSQRLLSQNIPDTSSILLPVPVTLTSQKNLVSTSIQNMMGKQKLPRNINFTTEISKWTKTEIEFANDKPVVKDAVGSFIYEIGHEGHKHTQNLLLEDLNMPESEGLDSFFESQCKGIDFSHNDFDGESSIAEDMTDSNVRGKTESVAIDNNEKETTASRTEHEQKQTDFEIDAPQERVDEIKMKALDKCVEKIESEELDEFLDNTFDGLSLYDDDNSYKQIENKEHVQLLSRVNSKASQRTAVEIESNLHELSNCGQKETKDEDSVTDDTFTTKSKSEKNDEFLDSSAGLSLCFEPEDNIQAEIKGTVDKKAIKELNSFTTEDLLNEMPESETLDEFLDSFEGLTLCIKNKDILQSEERQNTSDSMVDDRQMLNKRNDDEVDSEMRPRMDRIQEKNTVIAELLNEMPESENLDDFFDSIDQLSVYTEHEGKDKVSIENGLFKRRDKLDSTEESDLNYKAKKTSSIGRERNISLNKDMKSLERESDTTVAVNKIFTDSHRRDVVAVTLINNDRSQRRDVTAESQDLELFFNNIFDECHHDNKNGPETTIDSGCNEGSVNEHMQETVDTESMNQVEGLNGNKMNKKSRVMCTEDVGVLHVFRHSGNQLRLKKAEMCQTEDAHTCIDEVNLKTHLNDGENDLEDINVKENNGMHVDACNIGNVTHESDSVYDTFATSNCDSDLENFLNEISSGGKNVLQKALDKKEETNNFLEEISLEPNRVMRNFLSENSFSASSERSFYEQHRNHLDLDAESETDLSNKGEESEMALKTDLSNTGEDTEMALKTDICNNGKEFEMALKTDLSNKGEEPEIALKTDLCNKGEESEMDLKTDLSNKGEESEMDLKTDLSNKGEESEMALKMSTDTVKEIEDNDSYRNDDSDIFERTVHSPMSFRGQNRFSMKVLPGLNKKLLQAKDKNDMKDETQQKREQYKTNINLQVQQHESTSFCRSGQNIAINNECDSAHHSRCINYSSDLFDQSNDNSSAFGTKEFIHVPNTPSFREDYKHTSNTNGSAVIFNEETKFSATNCTKFSTPILDGSSDSATQELDQCIIFDSQELSPLERLELSAHVPKSSETQEKFYRRVKFDTRLRRVSSCHLMDIKMKMTESPLTRQSEVTLPKSCLRWKTTNPCIDNKVQKTDSVRNSSFVGNEGLNNNGKNDAKDNLKCKPKTSHFTVCTVDDMSNNSTSDINFSQDLFDASLVNMHEAETFWSPGKQNVVLAANYTLPKSCNGDHSYPELDTCNLSGALSNDMMQSVGERVGRKRTNSEQQFVHSDCMCSSISNKIENAVKQSVTVLSDQQLDKMSKRDSNDKLVGKQPDLFLPSERKPFIVTHNKTSNISPNLNYSTSDLFSESFDEFILHDNANTLVDYTKKEIIPPLKEESRATNLTEGISGKLSSDNQRKNNVLKTLVLKTPSDGSAAFGFHTKPTSCGTKENMVVGDSNSTLHGNQSIDDSLDIFADSPIEQKPVCDMKIKTVPYKTSFLCKQLFF